MDRFLKITDIIKIIPLEPQTREELLTNYESYDRARQFDIQRICWKAFNKLKEDLINMKYEEFLDEVEEGDKKLTGDLYKQAQDAVEKEFDDILAGKKEEVDQIDEIRTKLQQLMAKNKQ